MGLQASCQVTVLRTCAETASAAMTARNISSRITDTRLHSRALIEALSSKPIPPAPDRRLADIDIPSEHGNTGEGRQYLRPDSVAHNLQARRTCGNNSLSGSRVALLQGLVEQLGDKANGAKGNGDDARQHVRSDDGYQYQSPNNGIDGTRGDDYEQHDRAKGAMGVVLRAAKNANGTAITIAITVPSVAIVRVSHMGRSNLFPYAHSGGNIRASISAPCAGASTTKNHSVCTAIFCRHTTTTAKPMSQPIHTSAFVDGVCFRQVRRPRVRATAITSHPLANATGHTLGSHNDPDDNDKNCRSAVILVAVKSCRQRCTDATGADDADDGRFSKIYIQTINCKANGRGRTWGWMP